MQWAGWLGDNDRFTCEECRELAEANGNETDCGNCPYTREPRETSSLNLEAIKSWRLLDMCGRGLDGFSGVPLPLRLESITMECDKSADPEGLKWRIIALEEKIYLMRVEKFKARQDKRKSDTQ